uniref:LPXTG cell wall anchor domain-containing protein n=1 Tax=Mediterraneibacter glycyrrhizinilyticus TaxID=342942 RepID=UPI00241E00D7
MAEAQVGKILTYTISYKNAKDAPADIIITDIIPTGLDYVDGSAGDHAVYDADSRTITWTLDAVEPEQPTPEDPNPGTPPGGDQPNTPNPGEPNDPDTLEVSVPKTGDEANMLPILLVMLAAAAAIVVVVVRGRKKK